MTTQPPALPEPDDLHAATLMPALRAIHERHSAHYVASMKTVDSAAKDAALRYCLALASHAADEAGQPELKGMIDALTQGLGMTYAPHYANDAAEEIEWRARDLIDEWQLRHEVAA